ncbi:hypothetical protein FRB99_002138 [Tulasnella sp. 403]|nr:hypothetical protein FRB99_002138 [Tulasnella sp. 403]
MLNAPGRNIPQEIISYFTLTYQHRDVWPSREAALKELSALKAFKTWDPRTLELYTQYALRDRPAKDLQLAAYDGVTLACTRFHEAARYHGGRDFSGATVPILAQLSRTLPVHLVWGKLGDSL